MKATFNRLLQVSLKRSYSCISPNVSISVPSNRQALRFYSVQQTNDSLKTSDATQNSLKPELSPEEQTKVYYERSKRKVWGGLKKIRNTKKYVDKKIKQKLSFSNNDIDNLLLNAKNIQDYHLVIRVIHQFHKAHRIFKIRHVDLFVEKFLKEKHYDLLIQTLTDPFLSFGAYLTQDTAELLVQELLNIPEQADKAVKIVFSTKKRGLKIISKELLIKVADYQVEKGLDRLEVLSSAKFLLPENEYKEFRAKYAPPPKK